MVFKCSLGDTFIQITPKVITDTPWNLLLPFCLLMCGVCAAAAAAWHKYAFPHLCYMTTNMAVHFTSVCSSLCSGWMNEFQEFLFTIYDYHHSLAFFGLWFLLKSITIVFGSSLWMCQNFNLNFQLLHIFPVRVAKKRNQRAITCTNVSLM